MAKQKNKDKLAIAVDFDGTCVTHEYPDVGNDIGAIPVLKELVSLGHDLILFTMRDGKELQDAINWFKNNDIKLWGVQYNPTQRNWTKSNKCYANVYIDDAALGCPLIYPQNGDRPFVDWVRVREMLIEGKTELTSEDLEIKEFDKQDWAHLHDVILEVLGVSMDDKKLEELFRTLPSSIKDEALHWGLSDTVVRDNIYTHIKNNMTNTPNYANTKK
jgi:hydroxymethylpyrimidine pyrophosphatase-like HAD family hydrolase